MNKRNTSSHRNEFSQELLIFRHSTSIHRANRSNQDVARHELKMDMFKEWLIWISNFKVHSYILNRKRRQNTFKIWLCQYNTIKMLHTCRCASKVVSSPFLSRSLKQEMCEVKLSKINRISLNTQPEYHLIVTAAENQFKRKTKNALNSL